MGKKRLGTGFATEPIKPQTFQRADAVGQSRVGQEFEAQTLQQAGAAISEISGVVFKWLEREGNSQFDTARGQAQDRIGEFNRQSFADSADQEVGFTAMKAELGHFAPKNKSGASKYKSWMELNNASLEKIDAEKKIKMIAINNGQAYFNNMVNLAQITDRETFEKEAAILTAGAVDDKLRTPAQGAADLEKATDDWTRADLWRQAMAAGPPRPDGEVDWQVAVDWLNQNAKDMDKDTFTSLSASARTQAASQKSLDEAKLEDQREKGRDLLNDKFASNQIPTAREIDNANLDETEQKSYIKWAAQETRRVESGGSIVTNQRARADLNTMALDIWRGAISKKEFDSAVNEARYGETPTIDDEAYKELTNTAASTLKSAQAEELRRADIETGRLIVDFKEDDVFAKFISDSKKGLKPDIAKIFEKNANEERQLQFWYLSQYNKELRDWVTENPDKIGKDFFQHSEQLKHGYWNSSLEDIKARKLERETELSAEKIPTIKTQTEYDNLPKGTVYLDANGNRGTKR